jgi:hypothetical protein
MPRQANLLFTNKSLTNSETPRNDVEEVNTPPVAKDIWLIWHSFFFHRQTHLSLTYHYPHNSSPGTRHRVTMHFIICSTALLLNPTDPDSGKSIPHIGTVQPFLDLHGTPPPIDLLTIALPATIDPEYFFVVGILVPSTCYSSTGANLKCVLQKLAVGSNNQMG